MAINIDNLPAGTAMDDYGFPVLPKVAPETLPGRTLADMTNDYIHLKGRFWTRAPKMKQQKAATAILAGMVGCADAGMILNSLTQIAQQFLYVEDGAEQMRPATEDEIDDEFDLAEVQALVKSVTGIGAQEGNSKN